MEWRQQILKDVDILPALGTPGRIVVFGKQAEPILTGTNDEDVLVAAAELGNGRIVAITHNGYGKQFFLNYQKPGNIDQSLKNFFHNLKTWLTKDTFKSDDKVIDAQEKGSAENMWSSKIVICLGGPSCISPERLTEFVRNGGALLHCCTPWGWMQLNPGKTVSDIPLIALLEETGICYTGEYLSVSGNGFEVKKNKAADAHLLKVVDDVCHNINKATTESRMIARLKFVPRRLLGQAKEMLEKLWKFCNEEVGKHVPSSHHPISSTEDLAVFNLWQLCASLCDMTDVKAPGVAHFPGDLTGGHPFKCHDLQVHSAKEDYHSTFCYLPAGKTLKIETVSGNEGKDWQVLIGCHTDELDSGKLRRWPKVCKKVTLTDRVHQISSAFGGLVYLISPGKTGHVKVRIENVVDSPYFKLTDGEKGKEAWMTSRKFPGLWADIVGEYVTITVPSSSVRDMEFEALTKVMRTWDSVLRGYHDLRGTDISQFRRQWIVTDEQPSVGYMHSGYPIVTHLDVSDPKNSCFLLNGDHLIKDGNWGAFHEIGHNMQLGEWTFDGTGEVTCNIFTLYAMDSVCNLKPWIHNWLQGQVKSAEKYLKDGADFRKWKEMAGTALFCYAQLIHEFGWESYKQVFRIYDTMPDDKKPKDNQKKIDTWFSVFSGAVGFNLSPMARFWGIELTQEMVAHLRTAFPVSFLPDDEITQSVPDRVASLLREFPGTVRKRCTPA